MVKEIKKMLEDKNLYLKMLPGDKGLTVYLTDADSGYEECYTMYDSDPDFVLRLIEIIEIF